MAGHGPPGVLYVVATPIGNLEDITLRALRVLGEVELIAAEDTRRTARLLQHYSISTRTTSFHAHNERQKLPHLLARLQAGACLALVTDAGTPGIADPGAILVRAARNAGARVVAVPGASAVLAALASSGLEADGFVFAGFPPRRSKDREAWLLALTAESEPVVFFEAPHRLKQTLAQAKDVLGERQIFVARELTKVHEELVEGPISSVLDQLREPRGELTLVLPPAEQGHQVALPLPSDAQLTAEYGRLTNSERFPRRKALQTLARKYGMPTREVFKALERARGNRSNSRENPLVRR